MYDYPARKAITSTSQTAAEAFDPLVAKAIKALEIALNNAHEDPKTAADVAKYILDKKHGRTPDTRSGEAPLWMKVLQRKITNVMEGENGPNPLPPTDGVGVVVPIHQKTQREKQIVEQTETIFEFVWDDE